MSSMFVAAEVALARLALAAAAGEPTRRSTWWSAGWAWATPRRPSSSTPGALAGRGGGAGRGDRAGTSAGWSRSGRVLTADPRCRLVPGDFFALAASSPGWTRTTDRRFDAVVVDIDHSPRHLLHPSHAGFYAAAGLARLAAHLAPGGVFALWSNDPPDAAFERDARAVLRRRCASTVVASRTRCRTARRPTRSTSLGRVRPAVSTVHDAACTDRSEPRRTVTLCDEPPALAANSTWRALLASCGHGTRVDGRLGAEVKGKHHASKIVMAGGAVVAAAFSGLGMGPATADPGVDGAHGQVERGLNHATPSRAASGLNDVPLDPSRAGASSPTDRSCGSPACRSPGIDDKVRSAPRERGNGHLMPWPEARPAGAVRRSGQVATASPSARAAGALSTYGGIVWTILDSNQ